MGNELNVCVEGRRTGNLFQETDELIFRYNEAALPDQFVSLTMPVRRKDYRHPHLHPVFEIHLPEGYLLSIIKKQFAKITETDDFGLLRLLAPNVRGRVEYARNDQSEKSPLHLDTLLHSGNPGPFEELVSRFALRSALMWRSTLYWLSWIRKRQMLLTAGCRIAGLRQAHLHLGFWQYGFNTTYPPPVASSTTAIKARSVFVFIGSPF